jgi:hypothetical protein
MTKHSSDLGDEAPVPRWFTPTLLPPRLSNGRAEKLDRLLEEIGVDHPDRSTIAEALQLVGQERFRLKAIAEYLVWTASVMADRTNAHS